jgi:hypothetical protein
MMSRKAKASKIGDEPPESRGPSEHLARSVEDDRFQRNVDLPGLLVGDLEPAARPVPGQRWVNTTSGNSRKRRVNQNCRTHGLAGETRTAADPRKPTELLAMQKATGSSPVSRLEKPPQSGSSSDLTACGRLVVVLGASRAGAESAGDSPWALDGAVPARGATTWIRAVPIWSHCVGSAIDRSVVANRERESQQAEAEDHDEG